MVVGSTLKFSPLVVDGAGHDAGEVHEHLVGLNGGNQLLAIAAQGDDNVVGAGAADGERAAVGGGGERREGDGDLLAGLGVVHADCGGTQAEHACRVVERERHAGLKVGAGHGEILG